LITIDDSDDDAHFSSGPERIRTKAQLRKSQEQTTGTSGRLSIQKRKAILMSTGVATLAPQEQQKRPRRGTGGNYQEAKTISVMSESETEESDRTSSPPDNIETVEANEGLPLSKEAHVVSESDTAHGSIDENSRSYPEHDTMGCGSPSGFSELYKSTDLEASKSHSTSSSKDVANDLCPDFKVSSPLSETLLSLHIDQAKQREGDMSPKKASSAHYHMLDTDTTDMGMFESQSDSGRSQSNSLTTEQDQEQIVCTGSHEVAKSAQLRSFSTREKEDALICQAKKMLSKFVHFIEELPILDQINLSSEAINRLSSYTGHQGDEKVRITFNDKDVQTDISGDNQDNASGETLLIREVHSIHNSIDDKVTFASSLEVSPNHMCPETLQKQVLNEVRKTFNEVLDCYEKRISN
jgi:hypothetical protein